jgi:hypothetical protein
MGIIEINTGRYFELIDQEEKRKREGLGNPDALNPDTKAGKEYRELLHYRVILTHNLRFDNREKYSELIESYLEEKIDMGEFYNLFTQLWDKDGHGVRPIEEDLKKNSVSTISVDSRADKYRYLINTLYYWWKEKLEPEFHEPYDDDDWNNEAILQDHRAKTRETYLEIKQILQEE